MSSKAAIKKSKYPLHVIRKFIFCDIANTCLSIKPYFSKRMCMFMHILAVTS